MNRSATTATRDRDVVEYLKRHPDFFSQNKPLLTELLIPHGAGTASLLERQVQALREENQRLQRRFDDLLANARQNDQLISRIHQLVLELMETAGPRAIVSTLETRLREAFQADRICVRIFAETSYVCSEEFPQFVGAASPGKAIFGDQLKASAYCGRLTEAQQQVLLGGESFAGSAVVLPLSAKNWTGLLAILSVDVKRFDPNMGTEFLSYLADVTSLVLDPWVKKPSMKHS